MREILFRAKAINRNKGYHRTKYKNGDWVYGLITKLYDERFENLPAEMTNEYGVSGIDIDHKTIGQYTGLTDKNGQKIFEGDIISCYSPFGQNDFRNKIIGWSETFLSWMAENEPLYGDKQQTYEVVGNIHDNPELLKGATSDA